MTQPPVHQLSVQYKLVLLPVSLLKRLLYVTGFDKTQLTWTKTEIATFYTVA